MSLPEVEPLVSQKYEIKRRLGKGAYGIVWKAIDRRTGEIVAVKKIFDAFRNRTDAQRTFREVMFLQQFSEHPNIIKLLDVIRAENDKDIYLIFESMETDLHAVIKKGNLLKDIHKCYILYQLLKATKFIHSGNVIHRDQKPSNILLDADCFVKLCDFGLARSLSQVQEEQGSPALTEYVATRWYRAPEILLSSQRSCGCAVRLQSFDPEPCQFPMILERKLNGHQKEQMQRENAQLSQPESRPLLPNPSSVTLPARKGQRQATPPHLKASSVHAGAATSAQPPVPSQGEGLARALCQRAQLSVMYNPITHTAVPGNANSGAMIRSCSAPLSQQARTASSWKLGRQSTWANAQLPPTRVQNLHNNPRMTQFPSREVCPLPKPSKKMFQITANVGAAGDPKALMGSYSQAYGTIYKSALQSLPMPKSSQRQEQ